MPVRSNTFNYMCKSSQKWILNETERISYKIDKYFSIIRGYNKIKPRMLPKRLTSFLPSVIRCDDTIDLYDSTPAPRIRTSGSLNQLSHHNNRSSATASTRSYENVNSNSAKKSVEYGRKFAIGKRTETQTANSTLAPTETEFLLVQSNNVQTCKRTRRCSNSNQQRHQSNGSRSCALDANGVIIPEVVTTYNSELFSYSPNSPERVDV